MGKNPIISFKLSNVHDIPKIYRRKSSTRNTSKVGVHPLYKRVTIRYSEWSIFRRVIIPKKIEGSLIRRVFVFVFVFAFVFVCLFQKGHALKKSERSQRLYP